jgi:phenylpropionate dioxygenase-like ring-hydroxylating dioxygenase large terminal subunit
MSMVLSITFLPRLLMAPILGSVELWVNSRLVFRYVQAHDFGPQTIPLHKVNRVGLQTLTGSAETLTSRSTGTAKIPSISPESYISRDFALREKRKLWPNVWQVACREEEIPAPGDYLTYEIADESIILVRSRSGAIMAYHNVCSHRGRQLVEGCGKASQFRCRYHGWRFDLDGRNIQVLDRGDWNGGLDCEQLDLQRVRVAAWGGFVFIDMRSEGESLAEYLEPAAHFLDPFEYEKMRYRYYYTLHLPCNWKVAIEAFMEGYHVAGTHPQLLPIIGDDYTQSYAHGKHAHFGVWESKLSVGMPSPRLNDPPPADGRKAVMRFFEEYENTFKAVFTERDYEASKKLMDVLPPGVDVATAFMTAVELGRKAAEEEGAGYPAGLTWEHVAKAGADWHIFPNTATVPWFDGAVFYRARPAGDDPDQCIFDIWSLVRYAPGKEPPLRRTLFKSMSGKSVGGIPDQDIENVGAVQRGLHSRACTKLRPNPVQEMAIINFHQWLDRYLEL